MTTHTVFTKEELALERNYYKKNIKVQQEQINKFIIPKYVSFFSFNIKN